MRLVRFMRELNIDHGQFSNLIKFARQYRVAVPVGVGFPVRPSNNAEVDKEVRSARKLTGVDSL
jgi:hypothetical protein